MIPKSLPILVLACLPLLAATASSDTFRPATADPLGSLVEQALKSNLSLQGERLAERRAASEWNAARADFLPSVSLDSRASHQDHVQDLGDFINPAYAALNRLTGTNDFPTNLSVTLPYRYETHVRVTQPILNERIRENVSLQGARLSGQHCQVGAAGRRLAAAVQTAYLRHASALRLVGIYETSLERVRENERVAGKLLEAGSATPEAVLRSRADRAEVEQMLNEAREQAFAALRQLNYIAGRDPGTPAEAIPDSAFDVPLGLTAEEAVASALAGREELGLGDAGVRQAEAARRLATSSLLPSVAGVFDLGWQGQDLRFRPDNRFWSASHVASWPLFHVHDLAERSAAGYEADRARNARRDIEDQIRVEVIY